MPWRPVEPGVAGGRGKAPVIALEVQKDLEGCRRGQWKWAGLWREVLGFEGSSSLAKGEEKYLND